MATTYCQGIVPEASPPTYRAWLRGQRPEWERIPIFIKFTERPEGDIVAAIRNQPMGLYLGSAISAIPRSVDLIAS